MTATDVLSEGKGLGRYRPYPEYKDTGVEWLGKIPAHWRKRRLKSVSIIIMGQSPPSELYNTDGNGPAFLQGNADFGQKYPTPRIYCPFPAKKAQPGDHLLSVRAPVGAINTADRVYGIGRGLCAIRTSQKLFDRDFAFYTLQISRQELKAVALGSTYVGVSASEVANLATALPTNKEQRAIADFLDRKTAAIDALIAKKERLIELLEEKRAALITQAVTKGLDPNVPMKDSSIEWLGEIPEHWKVKKLKYLLGSPIQNGIFKTKDKFGSGTRLINVFDIYQDNFMVNEQDLDRVELDHGELSKFAVSPGDIFFVRSSLKLEGVGRSACAVSLDEPAVFECHLVRTRFDQHFGLPPYIILFLNSLLTTQRLISLANSVTMTTLPQSSIGSLEIILPTPNEQGGYYGRLRDSSSQLMTRWLRSSKLC